MKTRIGYQGLVADIFGDREIEVAEFSAEQQKHIAEICEELLAGLDINHRASDIIRRRFGINTAQETLQGIGDTYGIGKNRVLAIESHALRRMKHPERNRTLRSFLFEAGFSRFAPRV